MVERSSKNSVSNEETSSRKEYEEEKVPSIKNEEEILTSHILRGTTSSRNREELTSGRILEKSSSNE